MQVGVDAIAVAKTPYTLQFNDLINSANGPWASFTNAAIFGDSVDDAFAKLQGRDAGHHRQRSVISHRDRPAESLSFGRLSTGRHQ